MKIFKNINWKYIMVNIIGILIFIGIFYMYDEQFDIKNNAVPVVNMQQTNISDTVEYAVTQSNDILMILLYVFPFIFLGVVSVISTIKTKQKNGYAISTWKMSIIISILIFIYMSIESIIWKITGKVEYSSGGIISWGTDYSYIFVIGLFISIITIIGRSNSNAIYKSNLINN